MRFNAGGLRRDAGQSNGPIFGDPDFGRYRRTTPEDVEPSDRAFGETEFTIGTRHHSS